MFAYPLAGPRLPSEARQRLLAGAAAASGEAAPRDEPLGIECDSSSVLKSILMHSDAVSMMPRFMVDAEVRSGHLVVLPAIDFGIRTHFGAAWLRNRSMSGPGLKFIELTGGTSATEFVKPGSEIAAGESIFDRLTEKAESIAEKIEIVVNQLGT